MQFPSWRDPHRKRLIHISYTDPQYTKNYDIDLADFEHLVMKLKDGSILTDPENDRYGQYLTTICIIVLEGPKFRSKPYYEKQQILDQQIFEIVQGITMFDPSKGKIYSYAYRIAYTAACHYYTNIQDQRKKDKRITEHCQACLDDYMDEFSTHKKGAICHQ